MVGFEGDVDEVTCKMEHDMSSELEEAIDRMLGYPERAPDGTKVPVIERNLDISPKKYLLPLSYLPVGSTSKIEIIALDNTDQKTLEGIGLEVGTIITKEKEGVRFQEKALKLSESLMKKILTRMEDNMDESQGVDQHLVDLADDLSGIAPAPSVPVSNFSNSDSSWMDDTFS